MPAEETSSLFLSRWLQFAALMRLFSGEMGRPADACRTAVVPRRSRRPFSLAVVLGYFSPSTIHKNVYERVSAETGVRRGSDASFSARPRSRPGDRRAMES